MFTMKNRTDSTFALSRQKGINHNSEQQEDEKLQTTARESKTGHRLGAWGTAEYGSAQGPQTPVQSTDKDERSQTGEPREETFRDEKTKVFSDIPFSDLESVATEDKADIVSYQRLTVNNASAMLNAHSSIAIYSETPFSTHQSILSSKQISVPDVNDDLGRELAFYRQCLDAARTGRDRLRREDVPFTRPSDYFAEMVKNDEHMSLVKSKMVQDASGKKAAAEARKFRDLKKFGKQIQISRLQDRDKAKRETMDKIGVLKRKRRGTNAVETKEDEVFDVVLDEATDKGGRLGRGQNIMGAAKQKRQKDAKFGFGGKKRHAKSGDAISSGDLRGFSSRKMKLQRGSQRLGKGRRATRN